MPKSPEGLPNKSKYSASKALRLAGVLAALTGVLPVGPAKAETDSEVCGLTDRQIPDVNPVTGEPITAWYVGNPAGAPIRAEPKPDAESLGTFEYGSKLDVLCVRPDQENQTNWQGVSSEDGRIGWVGPRFDILQSKEVVIGKSAEQEVSQGKATVSADEPEVPMDQPQKFQEVPADGEEKPIVEVELLPESKSIDVTALPGWPSRSPEVFTRLKDGSVQIASPDTSSELRLLNEISAIEIGDGLELFIKMNAVSKADPSSPRTSQIILYDKQLANEKGLIGPVELHIGFDRNGYLTLAMLDLNQEDWAQRLKYFVTAQHGKKLTLDELRIKILNDSEGKTLYIFDGATDTLLIGGFRPPASVLGNNLNVGFYPQAGDRNGVILTVNALKVRPLAEDLA